MQSQATSVAGYLAELPEERRKALTALREVILKNLPASYEEVVSWGMISYEVPLAVYRDTYNKKPLLYAALASQKNHMSVHLSAVYGMPALRDQLEAGFAAAGKKLDCGASCVRFRKLDDIPINVIGRLIASVPVSEFVAHADACKASSQRKKATGKKSA